MEEAELAKLGKVNVEPLNDIVRIDPSEVTLEAINWNKLDDPRDLEFWNRLVSNFWVPEKIAVSNDLSSWATLTDAEKLATSKVFAGLTLLDTVQSQVGAVSLMPDARTAHEEAVYTNIAFMESIHARSYSNVFSTLLSSSEIEDIFRWSREDVHLKKKAAIVLSYYKGNDAEKRKIASVILESFLFYSGFFMPLWWSTKGKLTNTADIISLILRDESIHGAYIGLKFQDAYNESSESRQKELYDFTISLMAELYQNELHYTESIYDELGLTEHVKTFLRFNANKALNNLGFEAVFSDEETEVLPQIIAALGGDENHDFFSGGGSSYVIGTVAETEEEDWDF
jgi:ribonucleoside-diphosphate reductase beta chain